MRGVDVSSWQTVLSTLAGLALATLVGVGFRLLAMYTIQQRRERENRQINERLRTLIAAYKTLGGSFTGDLAVDPTHLRDLQRRATDRERADAGRSAGSAADASPVPNAGSDRSRRIRDAVEAALSDIILLGTEEHASTPFRPTSRFRCRARCARPGRAAAPEAEAGARAAGTMGGRVAAGALGGARAAWTGRSAACWAAAWARASDWTTPTRTRRTITVFGSRGQARHCR